MTDRDEASKPTIEIKAFETLELGAPIDLLVTCHGYESRSTAHLGMTMGDVNRRISFGFDFPSEDDESFGRISVARDKLMDAGFEVYVLDDEGVERRLRNELAALPSDRNVRVVADISSMNRGRIASIILACSSASFALCDLDLVYFPSSFGSHKHDYEPLESFGPIHNDLAGWPEDPDFPLALIIGLGTEPGRADGVLESLEPSVVSLFESFGGEDGYPEEILKENQRVIGVVGRPTNYPLRDPLQTYLLISAAVDRLSEHSRVVIVPMGPKIFCALTVAVALTHGGDIGVWKASAGRGVNPIDVKEYGPPVITRLKFVPIIGM